MYFPAKKACEEEEQLLRKLLSKIDEIHNMQYQMRRTSQMRRGALMQLLMYHARTMRLWIGPLDTHPPALVGAIGYPDSLPIKVGYLTWFNIAVIASFRVSFVHIGGSYPN